MAPKIPEIIHCDSSRQLEHELEYVRHDLCLNESEETWDKIARSIQYLEALTKGLSQALFYEFVSAVKLLARCISKAILSDRSGLSGRATELVTTLASYLRRAFEPLILSLVPTLLQGCARSNKVFVSKSKACLMAIVEHVQSPQLLPHFRGSVSDKSLSLRLISTELVLACMNCFNPPDLETVQRAEDIEAVIRATATDASAEVRKCSRSAFEAYKILLPGRLDNFVNPMSPTMKRYLAVTTKEKPTSLSSSTLSSSTSSTRRAEVSASTSSKPALSSSRSTKDLKKSATVTSGPSKTEVRPIQHKAVEHTMESQARKERPPTGPVRPPFSSRETMPPPKLSAEDKLSASTSSRPPSQQSQVLSRTMSVNLCRPATTTAPVHVGESIMTSSRTGARRPDPVFKRPASPSSKGDVAKQSSVSRPNSVLALEDLRRSTEERSTKGPRRVPKPPTAEEPDKATQSTRPAKATTSGSKPVIGDRQGLSRSADADVRKDALKAKLEAQKALGITERRPNKGHARAVSQPANMITKDKKPEAKNLDSKMMPPPPPRSASASSRPALTAPTLAQLARMKETASEAKARPVKTFTKTVKGARAVIKPLTIRKGKRKSSLKTVKASVSPPSTATDDVCDPEAESERPESSSTSSEPQGPPHHLDQHEDNVPSPTEDEPTIREIAVLQSLVITPPPDSPGSSSGSSSSEGTTASCSASEIHTPPRALFPTFPLQPAATPISALLFSIERGFVAPTPSRSLVEDNTLPYPDNDAVEESDDEESVLKNIDFAMDGIGSCGKILQSPRKKGINSEIRSPLGYVDTNCT